MTCSGALLCIDDRNIQQCQIRTFDCFGTCPTAKTYVQSNAALNRCVARRFGGLLSVWEIACWRFRGALAPQGIACFWRFEGQKLKRKIAWKSPKTVFRRLIAKKNNPVVSLITLLMMCSMIPWRTLNKSIVNRRLSFFNYLKDTWHDCYMAIYGTMYDSVTYQKRSGTCQERAKTCQNVPKRAGTFMPLLSFYFFHRTGTFLHACKTFFWNVPRKTYLNPWKIAIHCYEPG